MPRRPALPALPALLAGLVLCLVPSWAPPARAQERVYVDVGSPTFSPLPLAVAPFAGDPAAAEVAEVVRADLALSGVFDVLDPKGFLADPAEGFAAPSIRFTRWSDVGADGLVKARVLRDAEGPYAELHVYDVRAAREAFGRTLRGADARALGHAIADAVYRHYTGEPGVFRTRIAAIRKLGATRELVVMDADGKNPRALLAESAIMMLPAWSPDGRQILLTSYRTGKPELWVYRLADRSLRRLIAAGRGAYGGVYSPDGRQIAYSVSEGGNTDVWVANADGTGPRRLTRDRASDLSPSWSPDGKRIAFVSDRAGTPQIYVMNADGSEPRRVTFQGNYNQQPQWSPRGDQLLFFARDERKVFDVFAIELASGRVSRLTQDQGRTNEDPAWAPNGRLVVFATDRAGAGQLVVSDPRGDRQVVIAAARGSYAQPAWGPLPEEP
jgi:TolB protein